MRIPLVDLTKTSPTEQRKIHSKIRSVLSKGDFILGKEVENFEKSFAAYIGSDYCIGVASGSDALLLSLKAIGIEKGDEVIIPAMTFIATASSVLHVGATPIFVDIHSELPTIDHNKIEAAITKRTKAIIPVHMHGFPCAMDEILSLAKKYKLFVVEDACQAHGSTYQNKKAGNLGHLAAFSFYPSKNLGSYGDAGAITTSDKKLYQKLRMLRNHGQKKKSVHEILAYNSRLDSLQAAILSIKLTYLDSYNKKRRKNAAMYKHLLQQLPISVYKEPPNSIANYYVFGLEVGKRNQLLTYLRSKGISCDVHYPYPMHLHPAFKSLGYRKGDFPRAEAFADRTISLPMYPELSTKEIAYICKNIETFYKK